MTPVIKSKYEFRPDSLVKLRNDLKLKQGTMAERLGVPANTLSRWETGATTPDADSLALFYSVAKEVNMAPPEFFQRRRPEPKPAKGRDRLLIMWDFQNLGVAKSKVKAAADQVKAQLGQRFGSASYSRFKAFASPNQASATDQLMGLGWRVWEDNADMDKELVTHAKSDSGQEPNDTTFVLIAKDGGYAPLVKDLRAAGVDVYLIAPAAGCNEKLVESIGKGHWIQMSFG